MLKFELNRYVFDDDSTDFTWHFTWGRSARTAQPPEDSNEDLAELVAGVLEVRELAPAARVCPAIRVIN